MAHVWQAIPEPELVPYAAPASLPVRSMLVLAPHPDDEVFGCGGTLALAALQGVDARVVVVSDGAQGGNAAARQLESRRAALALGYDRDGAAMQFWRLPDRGVQPDAALVERLRQALLAQRPEWLLAPSPFEIHPDHRALCLAAISAAASCRVTLGFYEIGQPLMPSMLVDITPVMALKRMALECFPSQLASQRYDEHILALNRYRAYTLGPHVSHAEAYWFPDREDCGDAAGVYRGLQRLIARRLGVAP
ncbi:MAG: PIG-L family deacetylase [Rubrivivax sp.]|nr:PIG-L family deacetylase [Rubrivivax sp.]